MERIVKEFRRQILQMHLFPICLYSFIVVSLIVIQIQNEFIFSLSLMTFIAACPLMIQIGLIIRALWSVGQLKKELQEKQPSYRLLKKTGNAFLAPWGIIYYFRDRAEMITYREITRLQVLQPKYNLVKDRFSNGIYQQYVYWKDKYMFITANDYDKASHLIGYLSVQCPSINMTNEVIEVPVSLDQLEEWSVTNRW